MCKITNLKKGRARGRKSENNAIYYNTNPRKIRFQLGLSHILRLRQGFVKEKSCFYAIKEGGSGLLQLADDPIVRCMERCGWPPWLVYGGAFEDEEQEEDEDG